jgi:S1-C subfamily serine protease
MLARKSRWLAIVLPFFLVPVACPAGTIAEFGKPSVAPVLNVAMPGVVNISTKKVEVVDSPVLCNPVMRELLDIPERALRRLIAIPFDDSDLLEVGDFVLAIGNPFGKLSAAP